MANQQRGGAADVVSPRSAIAWASGPAFRIMAGPAARHRRRDSRL